MPRYDLSQSRASQRRTEGASANPGTAYHLSPRVRRKKEWSKRIFWTLAAAFTGYGVWRFMESRRDKPPVECVTVDEVEDYDNE